MKISQRLDSILEVFSSLNDSIKVRHLYKL